MGWNEELEIPLEVGDGRCYESNLNGQFTCCELLHTFEMYLRVDVQT